MGSSIYFLLILLLAMTSTVASQSDNTTESGKKASPNLSESPLKLKARASTNQKCKDGEQCYDCKDLSKFRASDSDTRKFLDIMEIVYERKFTLDEWNELVSKEWVEAEPDYSAKCKSGKCELKEVPGGLKTGICGSVKMQVTGYLFVLTITVIFLQDLLGFFGPESGLPMEHCCCGKEKTPKQSLEPEEEPPKPSCGEWTSGPAAAVAPVPLI